MNESLSQDEFTLFFCFICQAKGPELIIMHAATRVMYMEDVKEKVMEIKRGQRRVRRELFDLDG